MVIHDLVSSNGLIPTLKKLQRSEFINVDVKNIFPVFQGPLVIGKKYFSTNLIDIEDLVIFLEICKIFYFQCIFRESAIYLQ